MTRARALPSIPFFVSPDDPPSKREIMKAALALFTEHGLDGVTIRDIAARSGYTNPAIFKFFAGKDDLAEHLFVECYRELSRRFAATRTSRRQLSPQSARAARGVFGRSRSTSWTHFSSSRTTCGGCGHACPSQLRGASLLAIVPAVGRAGAESGGVAGDARGETARGRHRRNAVAGRAARVLRRVHRLRRGSGRWARSVDREDVQLTLFLSLGVSKC